VIIPKIKSTLKAPQRDINQMKINDMGESASTQLGRAISIHHPNYSFGVELEDAAEHSAPKM
jgi:hypothetical protein